MTAGSLLSIFVRDLSKLIGEIELYKNEENIWRVENKISNSAGNLALYIISNLHTFIRKETGKKNYIKNRELEFSQKNISRNELTKIYMTL